MSATVNDIVKIMDGIAPRQLAEDWDNAGFLIGRGNNSVKKIMVALDVSPEVVRQAVEHKVEMLITHHPPIFKPLKNICDSGWQNALLLTCIENGIAVYSAHTSLDSVLGGVNDVLAEKLGLERTVSLVKNDGNCGALGRVGYLPHKMKFEEFAEKVKKTLGLPFVTGISAGKTVHKVALCGGAGIDFAAEALEHGADTYVTGDIKYHEAQNAVFSGLNLIDATHQGTELPVITVLADKISLRLAAAGFDTQVLTARETLLFNQY